MWNRNLRKLCNMDDAAMPGKQASERILVVDDQEFYRKKLSKAVEVLGYQSVTARDGHEGLQKLQTEAFDLVLLDIMMPGMDGFEVLRKMRADDKLRHIPVIVISALDGEMSSVVSAIETGARDFLPKNFDAVLLRARLSSSLERKRFRDREMEQLHQVNRLTDAAAILEHSMINPDKLKISDISDRTDAIGQLSRVFTDMARQIHARERRLRQQVRTLKGSMMLFSIGLISGLGVVLSRMAADISPHPFGIALWTNLITMALCLSVAKFRGRMPKLNMSLIKIFLLWGMLSTIFGEVVVFWVAQKLPASIIALILVSEGFMVFAFASLMRVEVATSRRLIGFFVGLIGVGLVIYATGNSSAVNSPWIWALMALVAPMGYACRTLLVTLKVPADMDIVAAAGFSSFAAVILLAPLVIALDDFIPLSLVGTSENITLVSAVILFGIVSALGVSMRVSLIRSAGAVFASQSSFIITFAGIVWSIILLGERLPGLAWFALALLVTGLLLVGPKDEADEVDPLAKIDIGL